ncbi:TonB-dependent receptor [Croceimicrobium hydrocarbonivorans]|uniref:TonB-dependent receptor n=1 Tax=Croceimicrobium hydrocarbonivorans TaxID=2761580 RepID=A0A7H0VCQ8_9FLAO|nr:TonB-dependent receptor [Croceimicrobium hydrocarbonivorans]QNR23506.1 TonB-dependent receptor [Croceimicrobium hydrocarbonivorans]
MRLVLSALSLLLFSQYAWAQTQIFGRISDVDNIPIDGARVGIGDYYTLTDEEGKYELDVIPGKKLMVYFANYNYQPDTTYINLAKGEKKEINRQLKLLKNELGVIDIVDRKGRFDNQVDVSVKSIESFVGPNSGVEGIIKTLPGVSSYSELSSQYSVRGGNFDENLVYVNGIEVYRPFLVRNGQQEGMSFVNSSMVSNVRFSAGGFEARYGDKMASVLDITYRKPKEFGLSLEGSLLGGNLVYEDRFAKDRVSALIGARYRTNQLLLGSLDTEADFKPQFTDIQAYITYDITDEWELSFLGNYSRNLYQVVPQSRTTDFGTIQESLRLNVFFDGREDYDFTTRFAALGLTNRPKKNMRLTYQASVFQTTEQEYFDVLGAYRLGELNTNLGSDQFGEISFTRSIGGFQNYARNYLDAIVANLSHSGLLDQGDVTWRWGAKVQMEDIIDRYKEWERIDSAGYNVPDGSGFNYDSLIVDTWDSLGNPVAGNVYTSILQEDELNLFESFASKISVNSVRATAYVERSQIIPLDSLGDLFYNIGIRNQYWSFNNQNVISPRASISFKPNWESDMVFRFATGFYYQPPFYREMRNLEGGLNENIRAQRSIHFVLGHDYNLRIWNRPFKMVTEVYYKDFGQLIPYDMDNVRIRYRAVNNAKGYATGIDYRINGEFVPGIDSWASLSIMTIREDIEGDGAGYLPRPTDQRLNFKIFFQDYLPNDPTFRVSMTLAYGTGLPFGPPQATAEERVFRLPDYRRVDIGFSKVIKSEGREHKWKVLNNFSSLWVGVEVFNLLDITNTISYLWVKDISTAREYAVPNYLTPRLLNVKLVAKI